MRISDWSSDVCSSDLFTVHGESFEGATSGDTADGNDRAFSDGVSQTVTIDDVPVASNDTGKVREGGALTTGNLLSNDQAGDVDLVITEVGVQPVASGSPAILTLPPGPLTVFSDGNYTSQSYASGIDKQATPTPPHPANTTPRQSNGPQ